MLALLVTVIVAAAPSNLPGAPVLGSQGQLELAVGVLSSPLPGALELSARQFAMSRRAELGLPATSVLIPSGSFATRFGGSLHYLQQAGGLEVYGGKVIVTVDG